MSEALSIIQNATEGKYAADKTEVRTLLVRLAAVSDSCANW